MRTEGREKGSRRGSTGEGAEGGGSRKGSALFAWSALRKERHGLERRRLHVFGASRHRQVMFPSERGDLLEADRAAKYRRQFEILVCATQIQNSLWCKFQ